MNIVFLTSSLGSGGAERVATTLCNAWAARGDNVTLIPTFSGGGQPFYDVPDSIELIYLADVVGARHRSIIGYAKRIYALRKLIVEREPDVIISFLPNVNVAAVLVSSFLRIPLIISERRDPSSQPCSYFWESACRLTYRFADMLTVQTETVAAKVKGIYPGLNKVSSIPNPLPSGVAALKRKAGNQRKVLLSLGRLSAEKQIDKILNAFNNVAFQFDDWDLHIYGDGLLKHALDSQIEALGLRGRVFLKGRTSEPWKIMASADAFVMTSKYEGFPNALLEAMGIGLACIVFDCPSGPREITRDGKDALLVPLNDHEGLVSALLNIMGDEDFRNSLGDQARGSVLNRFSLSAVVDSWDHLFNEVGAIS